MEKGGTEQGYSCKFCNKSFVTGKSLGGHMRGHLALISAQKAKEVVNGDCFKKTHMKFTEKPPHVEENKNDNGDGYGLRENPKKSWRASGLKPNAVKENGIDKNYVCKECGKGFLSMRALSGHMRCHSMKSKEESTCKKCGKEFDSIRALFGHMRSHSKRSIAASVSNESAEIETKLDYEPPFAIPIKRLRTKYKVTSSNPCSSSNLNASSSSVVTDTNEVEEVAMCLMMLSRGMKNWEDYDFHSVKSNNDTVIFEAQSLIKNWEDYDSANGEEVEKMNCCVSGPTNVLIVKNFSEFRLFDSGSAIDGENKTKTETYVNDSISNDRLENPTQFTNDIGYNQADSNLMKPNSSNKPNFNSLDLDSRKNSLELVLNSSESKHETVVTSIQTTRLLNFEANFDVEKNLQYNENHVDEETNQAKNKEHECSICFKVFESGQALGGHKRAHYIGLTDQTRATEAVLINEELPVPDNIRKNNLFDLNVPLSLEDGAASEVGFMPWWVEGDHEYEPLVIFN